MSLFLCVRRFTEELALSMIRPLVSRRVTEQSLKRRVSWTASKVLKRDPTIASDTLHIPVQVRSIPDGESKHGKKIYKDQRQKCKQCLTEGRRNVKTAFYCRGCPPLTFLCADQHDEDGLPGDNRHCWTDWHRQHVG